MLAILQWLWLVIIHIYDILLWTVAHLTTFIWGSTPTYIVLLISIHWHIFFILINVHRRVHVVHHLLVSQMLVKHRIFHDIPSVHRWTRLPLLINEALILILRRIA